MVAQVVIKDLVINLGNNIVGYKQEHNYLGIQEGMIEVKDQKHYNNLEHKQEHTKQHMGLGMSELALEERVVHSILVNMLVHRSLDKSLDIVLLEIES